MSDALMKVSTGFKLVYYGLLLVVLAVVVALLGGCVIGAGAAAQGPGGAAAGPPAGLADGLMVLGLVVGGLAILGSIVGLIGRFMCMAVPPETGAAKPMIIISVVLELVSLMVSIGTTVDNVGGNFIPPELKMAASGGGALFSIIAAILFLLFTRSVALFVRREDLADRALKVLWLWLGFVLCYVAGLGVVLVGVLAAGPAGQGGGAGAGAGAAVGGACFGLVLILAALVIALVALVLYARLLIAMSESVRKFAASGRYDRDDYDDDYDDRDDDDRRDRDEQRPWDRR